MLEWPLATPMMGFSKSPSPNPTARSMARFGERAAPWVMFLDRHVCSLEIWGWLHYLTTSTGRSAY